MSTRPIVLVTGASKGIGAATAVAFAKAGYDVCVNYNSDAEGATETVERCKSEGARAVAAQADVADRDSVTQMFESCDKLLGPLSCLVNNAGVIGGASTINKLKPESLIATFGTNVFGMVYCIQEAVKRMATDQGGDGGAISTCHRLPQVWAAPVNMCITPPPRVRWKP